MKHSLKNIVRVFVISTEQIYLRREISLLLLVLLISCSNKTFNTEEELWTYLRDESNGFVQQKTVNGYNFSLVYKPTDLLVHQELGDNAEIDEIEKLRGKYGQYLYFNLSMSKDDKELLSVAPKTRNEFGTMVNQLAFGIGNKVHLFTQEKDTIELADFVYPRMYGMSRSTDILLVYPREERKLIGGDLSFTIEDLGLYTGEVKLKIPIKNINSEPKLKF